MLKKVYCLVSGGIFGLVAVLHLLRIFEGWAVQIGPFQIPMAASIAGVFAAGLVCVWGFLAARK